MKIQVLGPGCAKCKQAEEIVRQAVAEAGVAAEVEKVTDLMEMAALGIMATPAVVVDGQVKLAGRVPDKAQVKAWLGR